MVKTVYVAASLADHDIVSGLLEKLRKVGVGAAFDWTVKHKNKIMPNPKDMIVGVVGCDLFVFVGPGGRGAHVELGAALAKDKPIVLVTDQITDETLFYKGDRIARVATVEDAFYECIRILLRK